MTGFELMNHMLLIEITFVAIRPNQLDCSHGLKKILKKLIKHGCKIKMNCNCTIVFKIIPHLETFKL